MERVGTKGLAILTLVLAGALALAWTNPTERDYEGYQDELLERALTRMGTSKEGASRGLVRQLLGSKEGLFLKSLIRSQTTRLNLGLCSLFETRLLSTELVVLGVGGTFLPLTDPEEALRALEKTAVVPSP